MATFVPQPSGSWRAIIRRKQAYASKSFRLKADAERFQYGAVSWAHKETVIARIEATALGRDARFVVTNLPGRGKHHRGHVARSHAG